MDPPPPERKPSPSFDSSTTRRAIIISYYALIIAGLPLWWKTTSITRLPLPTTRIYQAADKAGHLVWPVTVKTCGGDIGGLDSFVRDHRPSAEWEGLDVRIAECAEVVEDNAYTVYFDGKDKPYVQGRSLHVDSDAGNTFPVDLCCIHTQIVHCVGDSSWKLLSSLLSISHSGTTDGVTTTAVEYASRYRLSFTLLSEDASTPANWDINSAIDTHIVPLLKSLSPLHTFILESQVQVQAPLAFEPIPAEEGQDGVVLSPADLSVFVNSAEWTLCALHFHRSTSPRDIKLYLPASSASADPVLHFVLFLPSAQHAPMRISDAQGNEHICRPWRVL